MNADGHWLDQIRKVGYFKYALAHSIAITEAMAEK